MNKATTITYTVHQDGTTSYDSGWYNAQTGQPTDPFGEN